MSRRLPDFVSALLPWFGAALIWLAAIEPLRAEKGARLGEQSQVRRAKVMAERTAREARALTTRINAAMASACQASAEPASLRQRIVGATASLNLAKVSLTVTGGADGGATIEAAGTRRAARELLTRLGDPAFGGFLRSVTIREQQDRWNVSLVTGLLGPFPSGIGPASSPCGGASFSEPPPLETPTAPSQEPWLPKAAISPRVSLPAETAPLVEAPEPTSPPFTLVAFIESEGKRRVSVRSGGEIRVVSVGDLVDGWSCVSIDRDEGAVFTSPTQGRLVLKATSGAGR